MITDFPTLGHTLQKPRLFKHCKVMSPAVDMYVFTLVCACVCVCVCVTPALYALKVTV